MAKSNRQLSVKGGASSNLRACNLAHSDAHNLREGNTRTVNHNPNLTIRPELTENNSSWVDESVPNLKALDAAIRKDYASVDHTKKIKDSSGNTKEVVYHREMPTKGKTAASPIKESILNLPHNGKETDEMVNEFIHRWEHTFGVKCIRAFVHRDERYDDPDTGESHFNCHAHLVWNFYNWQQHSLIKLKKEDLRLTEDWAAEITGMPRGTSATITNASHLTVSEFKNKKERERTQMIIKEQEEQKERTANSQKEFLQVNDAVKTTSLHLAALKAELDEKRRKSKEKFTDKARAFITGGQTKIEKENTQLKDKYNILVSKYTKLVNLFKRQETLLAEKDRRIEAETSEKNAIKKEYEHYVLEQRAINTDLKNEISTLKKEVSTWYGIIKNIFKYIKDITNHDQQNLWKNWINKFVKPEQVQSIEKDILDDKKQQNQVAMHRYGRGI